MSIDVSDNGTCAGCGKRVNMDADRPCDHGVVVCDMCEPAAACDRCRADVEREALDEVPC